MVYMSRRNRTNTGESDKSVREEPETVNPFALNPTGFMPFTESISGAGHSQRQSNVFGPAPGQPASARVSSHHALGQPDHSKFEYQVLYTENAIPTTEMEIPPSPTTFTLADRMCQQLVNTPSPSQGQIPVTTMEIPENIEEVEIDKEVGPDE
ncbi:hypothetical protein J3R30DRAFT_3462958 [Lentinula aciculospora]|uniref:Uncharacterized protein n=1 Tax=Lentinula aciculospora TaxID=153920 RepID=A0A9W9AEK0_9AGAR|nr:hypothetical protein J3R30DRAFT_3462958 [Lentinula aciculospora]